MAQERYSNIFHNMEIFETVFEELCDELEEDERSGMDYRPEYYNTNYVVTLKEAFNELVDSIVLSKYPKPIKITPEIDSEIVKISEYDRTFRQNDKPCKQGKNFVVCKFLEQKCEQMQKDDIANLTMDVIKIINSDKDIKKTCDKIKEIMNNKYNVQVDNYQLIDLLNRIS